MSSYPTKAFRRTALAPGILAAIVLLAGVALIDSSAFVWIEFPTAILALIVSWYAFQARQWWWIAPLLAIAVLWNPILPIAIDGRIWVGAQYIAILVFILAGIFIKIRNEDDRNARIRKR
jgi:hypothetical protein